MRGIILKARKAYTKPFSLNDLPKAGRMDVVARSIIASLFVSYKIRPNVKLYIILEGPDKPPKLLTFDSSELRGVYPTERSVASIINKAVSMRLDGKKKVQPGLWIEKKSFNKLTKELVERNQKLYYLVENGKDIRKAKIAKNSFFIVGDHLGLDKKTEKFLARLKIPKISLGRVSYYASQAITILHYELDRREYG